MRHDTSGPNELRAGTQSATTCVESTLKPIHPVIEAAAHPLAWLDDELGALESRHHRRRLRLARRLDAVHLELDGRRLVNFGSNDYLSLAGDKRLAEAAAKTASEEGTGSGASPLLTGRGPAHERLERELAHFEGAEAALVFPTGFAANLATITALAGADDVIFSDALNHASLIDGCRLSRATVSVYRHCDVEHLEELLSASPPAARRWIVTDSLFSMDGDTAPLEQLADLAERYDAVVIVDEAHATGVLGQDGRGVVEQQHVESSRFVRLGTLSKALGGAGGFVVGSQSLVDWIANRGRSYIFSTALPPVMAAAASRAIELVQTEPFRRRELLARADDLRQRLAQQGWDTGKSVSQIVPVIVDDEQRALELAASLEAEGLFVPAIRPPSVPPGASRLRISVCYGHTPEMIDRLIVALGR